MRIVFVAALVAGASFCLAAWMDWRGGWFVVWKGAGVALLALWAALERVGQGSGPDRRLIATALALGATGDVLLEVLGLVPGALAFLSGHLAAIALYRRNGARGWALIAAAAVGVAAVSAWVTRDAGVGFYALALGGMAGAAGASGFPRRVAIGAWLFVASDLLIFARMGVFAESLLPRLLIWPLYFAGQALIAHGVVTTLVRDDHLHHRL